MKTTNQQPAHNTNSTDQHIQPQNQASDTFSSPKSVRIPTGTQSDNLNQKSEHIMSLMHDLKNPLSVIYGSACLLQRDDLSPKHKDEAINNILDSVQGMRELISDWLNLTKLSTSDWENLRLEQVSLSIFLKQCVNSFSDLAKARNIKLYFSPLPEDTELVIDPNHMVRALNNLISNAIKYTPDGGEVRVIAELKNDHAVIQISDTGIGIVAEELPRIFDRFYRSHRSVTSKISGTGLGLAISKTIIERHNGTISVESTPDKGTTFTLTLPCLQSAGVV